MATGVGVLPLAWLAMFRRTDLVRSGAARFTTEWETARERLDDPQGLQKMFAEYGDISPYTRALSETLARTAGPGGAGSHRISVAAGEIAGEHHDPRGWAKALAIALDALDDPAPEPAPWARPEDAINAATAVEKIQRLRRASDLGISEARALLARHDGDLRAALNTIEEGRSDAQRARDSAGAFVASLVHPTELPARPPWQVLVEASGILYGHPFPDVDLFHGSTPPAPDDARAHARLLGESATPGGVSWEPS